MNHICVSLAGISFRIHSDHDEVMRQIGDYYRHHLMEEESGPDEYDLSIMAVSELQSDTRVMGKTLEGETPDGLRLWTAPDGWLVCDQNLSRCRKTAGRIHCQLTLDSLRIPDYPAGRMLWFVLIKTLWERRKYILHGALLEQAGTRIIICGTSGSGKSSLALTLLHHGFRVLADDASFYIRRGESIFFYPFFQDIQVFSRTFDYLPARVRGGLNVDEDQHHQRKCRILLERPRADRGPLAPPQVIIFPRITGRDDHRLRSMAAVEAIDLLISQSMLPGARPVLTDQLGVITQILQQARLFRLEMGKDLLTAGDLIRSVVV